MIGLSGKSEQLDEEWLILIMEAKKMGLNPNEIREFLNNPNTYSEVLSINL
ncbi:DNA-binding anti-repressor SinI [Ornithinibacillus sp. L9]|uniref:DNA-binding anti-repressor SinI n=2 Tax=Ornithinibacillus caprae TaxID=2678566 RepID=A0A6N8FML5_9BACI|nr:anti-repressor SinI family protein [Ornithinibacillus caprae]MUK88989.1 DNA-binding anti-repressor SinI [Ornithinibacillus caprae]